MNLGISTMRKNTHHETIRLRPSLALNLAYRVINSCSMGCSWSFARMRRRKASINVIKLCSKSIAYGSEYWCFRPVCFRLSICLFLVPLHWNVQQFQARKLWSYARQQDGPSISTWMYWEIPSLSSTHPISSHEILNARYVRPNKPQHGLVLGSRVCTSRWIPLDKETSAQSLLHLELETKHTPPQLWHRERTLAHDILAQLWSHRE